MKKLDINLVPDCINPSPDYYCTWQTQLYASNNGGPQAQRDILNEAALFGDGYPLGWTKFYSDAKRDLLFVIDDSWDVPYGETPEKSGLFGSLILDKGKFPSFAADGTENHAALKSLADAVKARGWKGFGGWVCPQVAPKFKGTDREEYWKKRLIDADRAETDYWKIDWGEDGSKFEVRQMITELKRQYAPKLFAEQAGIRELVPKSDVFRTYDVIAIMSIPMTLPRLADTLSFDAEEGRPALVNCEDEVYIAAALGCTMGVMRQPMAGVLPNGNPDPSFPNLHRNLKTKMCEVTRAVRWHRIAPAFAVNGSETKVSDEILTDSWNVVNQSEEIEAWWKFKDGDVIEKSAPSSISRGLPLPIVTSDVDGKIPYTVSAKNPNGAASIATLGRTEKREYKIPECDIIFDTENAEIFGIFGEYKALTVKSLAVKTASRILAQDLAGDFCFDITEDIKIGEGFFVLNGKIISEIGTSCNPDGDTSEPGMLVKIV